MNRLSTVAGLPLLLAGLACLALTGSAVAEEPKKEAKQPTIDLVLCLDTSGSMGGLIESAKVKLWDIVNELARSKPTPRLRIALYTYGSPEYGAQSGWVRKNLDFTGDLDMVYQKLFAVRINGGAEYCARVAQAALDELKWSEGKALRLIFVCGNEPADQDPKITLEAVAKNAIKRDIFINTIHCGQANKSATASWEKLAALAEGRFANIDHNRGAVAIATPVDKKLAALGEKLNTTYLWYGKEGKMRAENQLAQDANAAKLGGGVQAARAASKGTGFYRMAEADLVDRVLTDPKCDISKIPEKELPEALQKLKPAERVKYVEQKKTERLALQKEVADLQKQRQEFIREHQKKHANQADQAFDQAIRATLQAQAEKKGIHIPK